jgi:hypothetical protein
MTLLAVDPSLRSTGWAWFVGGALARVGRNTRKATDDAIARRAANMAEAVLLNFSGVVIDRLVVEWPQVYRAARSKGDPNDLLGLAAIAGILVSGVEGRADTPTPREWSGGVPKATRGDPLKSARGVRVWSRLRESERAVLESTKINHDVVDAVGIGLWALGRFAPARYTGGGA